MLLDSYDWLVGIKYFTRDAARDQPLVEELHATAKALVIT